MERDRLVHTLGNLTLLTGPLNGKVSNGPWAGAGGKWEALHAHDVLLLNRDLRNAFTDGWTHESIRGRTEGMIRQIIEIWPAPEGHRSAFTHEKTVLRRHPDIVDLMNAGLLTAGMTLYPGRKKYEGRTATLLADGQIDVNGTAYYQKPQAAAAAITGKLTFGWWFFRVDKTAGRSLRDVLREYVAMLPAS